MREGIGGEAIFKPQDYTRLAQEFRVTTEWNSQYVTKTFIVASHLVELCVICVIWGYIIISDL